MNAPFLRPHGCPVGVDPRTWREAVEARIEQLQDVMLSLIAALDAMETDCDLEPSLAGFGRSSTDDREGGDIDENEADDLDREGDEHDDLEPSLGWSTPRGDRGDGLPLGWAYHAFGLGADHDD